MPEGFKVKDVEKFVMEKLTAPPASAVRPDRRVLLQKMLNLARARKAQAR